jgi:hypothetical protein
MQQIKCSKERTGLDICDEVMLQMKNLQVLQQVEILPLDEIDLVG